MKMTEDLQLLAEQITRSTFITVPIRSTTAIEHRIPRQSKLDNSLIVGIQTFTIDDASDLPTGNLTNVADAIFDKAFITLEDNKSNQFLELLPLVTMNKTANAGERFRLNYQIINFENSFIKVANATGQQADTGFLLQVDYIYTSDFKNLGVDISELMKRFEA